MSHRVSSCLIVLVSSPPSPPSLPSPNSFSKTRTGFSARRSPSGRFRRVSHNDCNLSRVDVINDDCESVDLRRRRSDGISSCWRRCRHSSCCDQWRAWRRRIRDWAFPVTCGHLRGYRSDEMGFFVARSFMSYAKSSTVQYGVLLLLMLTSSCSRPVILL